MGQFSFITSDTCAQITVEDLPYSYALPCAVIAPDNTLYIEEHYEGYGIFGGHDVFALLAMWNAPEKCCGEEKVDRELGIAIYHGLNGAPPMKFPLKIIENYNQSNINYHDFPSVKDDPNQGWPYEEGEEDEEY